MPLSSLGGFAQGMNEGLRNLAALQQMKNTGINQDRADRAEARAVELRGREDAEYGRQTKEIPIEEFASRIDGGHLAIPVAERLGLVNDGKIRVKDLPVFEKALNEDKETQYKMLTFQKEKMGKDIEGIEASAFDQNAPNPELVRTLREKKNQLRRLNFADRKFQQEEEKADLAMKVQEQALKHREVAETRAKDKAKGEQEDRPYKNLPKDSGEALAIYTRTKKPEDLKMYQTMKADELEKEAAKAKTRQAALGNNALRVGDGTAVSKILDGKYMNIVAGNPDMEAEERGKITRANVMNYALPHQRDAYDWIRIKAEEYAKDNKKYTPAAAVDQALKDYQAAAKAGGAGKAKSVVSPKVGRFTITEVKP